MPILVPDGVPQDTGAAHSRRRRSGKRQRIYAVRSKSPSISNPHRAIKRLGQILRQINSGFECAGQDYCVKSFNTPSTITYTDSTLSTQQTVYGITASPIQIRFKASESTIVPVPTDSFKLPKEQHSLDKRAKAGIGIGVLAGVVLLGACVFFAVRHYRRKKASVEPSQPARNIGNGISSEDYHGRMGLGGEGEPDGDLDPPPAYTGPISSRK